MKASVILLLSFSIFCSCQKQVKVSVKMDSAVENSEWMIGKFGSFLKERGIEISEAHADFQLNFKLDKSLPKEGYALTVSGSHIEISGADKNGLIYGMYNLMEQVRFKGSFDAVSNKSEHPRMAFRAIKFNLPYMAYRTDMSMVQHDVVCHDLKFWKKYLDMMVENRFNVLSLWSLHLFHYMVIPKDFPEANQFNRYEMAEWKKFWTALFKMAKDRGIETYIINWNTFVSPSFARAYHVAEYSEKPSHFGVGDTSKLVEQYTREIIRQVIDEYPDLTGLGITLGERMGGQTADERRAWLDRTIFAGMRDASRKIKFVYRAPLSADKKSGGSTSEENDLKTRKQIEGLDVKGPVWVEFKYNWSHGHSSPNLFIVHGGKLSDKYRKPLPEKYKYVWTVRNEDFLVHRWGQPDFVRKFIKNNGQEYVGGCFIGSEVFIPAKDYVSKEGNFRNWDYAFERQWLWYAVWGRLLYNPATSDDVFKSLLEEKYGKGLGNDALAAWKQASRVPLLFASFIQGRSDGTLYTEGFCGWRENGNVKFFDINKFLSHAVLDTIRFSNIVHFVRSKGNLPQGMMSPVELADTLDQISNTSLKLVERISTHQLAPSVDCELSDIKAWSWFARYFADKIRAGVALTKYRLNNEPTQQEAVKYLEKCVSHWKHYINATMKYNKEEFLFHTKDDFSWTKMLDFVKKDIELAKRTNQEIEAEKKSKMNAKSE